MSRKIADPPKTESSWKTNAGEKKKKMSTSKKWRPNMCNSAFVYYSTQFVFVGCGGVVAIDCFLLVSMRLQSTLLCFEQLSTHFEMILWRDQRNYEISTKCSNKKTSTKKKWKHTNTKPSNSIMYQMVCIAANNTIIDNWCWSTATSASIDHVDDKSKNETQTATELLCERES